MRRSDLIAQVRHRLATEEGPTDDAALATALQASGRVIGSQALAELTRAARAELFGAGPLQVLLEDPATTDVLVNGPRDVWVDRGSGLTRVPVTFTDAAEVRTLAVRLAAAGGQRLDDAQPLADARLPDGTRLHAVIAPVCEEGATISLRVLRTRSVHLSGLVRAGAVPTGWEALLRALVARSATMLVSGGTGTGKTTLLAALLALVPPDERIICVEEARELVPDHPHVVALTARRPNIEGAGGVGLIELVRAALRMRPDRIVLGECRGAEVREVLMAFNTGHEGGLATIHANDATTVPARLEALAALAHMDREAVAAQTIGGLDVVLHLRRGVPGDRGRRFLSQVGVVGRAPSGRLVVEPAALWDGIGQPSAGVQWGHLCDRWLRGPVA